jgi:hypothetical protein
MFTFAHLYKAAVVDRSKANLLTNEEANGAPRPLLRRGLEFPHGLPSAASDIVPEPEPPGSKQLPMQ